MSLWEARSADTSATDDCDYTTVPYDRTESSDWVWDEFDTEMNSVCTLHTALGRRVAPTGLLVMFIRTR